MFNDVLLGSNESRFLTGMIVLTLKEVSHRNELELTIRRDSGKIIAVSDKEDMHF